MYTGLCNRVEPLRMDMYPLHGCEVVTYPPQQILVKTVGGVFLLVMRDPIDRF